MAMSYGYELQARICDRMIALTSQAAPAIPRTFVEAMRGVLARDAARLDLSKPNDAPRSINTLEMASSSPRLQGAWPLTSSSRPVMEAAIERDYELAGDSEMPLAMVAVVVIPVD